jgi:hypothetical protein
VLAERVFVQEQRGALAALEALHHQDHLAAVKRCVLRLLRPLHLRRSQCAQHQDRLEQRGSCQAALPALPQVLP